MVFNATLNDTLNATATTVAPVLNITSAPPLTIEAAIDEFLTWYYGANGYKKENNFYQNYLIIIINV